MTPPKILQIALADDDSDDRGFFREVLQELRPESILHEFVDGKQIIEYMDSVIEPPPPHIIFLDINMPIKTGIQCLKEIRADVRFKDTPVVMFTTSNSVIEIDNTFECGANLFIRKPYSYIEGLRSLQNFFTDFDSGSIMHVPRDKFFVE